MQEPHTEARCSIGIRRKEEGGTRPLTHEEFCEFVSDFADHLIEDPRTIDPVVSGDAHVGEIEIAFGLSSPIEDRDTSVQVFDIVHDAGSALGAEWFNESQRGAVRHRELTATTMLSRHSQKISATDLVSA